MTKNLVSDLLDELKSNETFTRNDAIKKIIKDKINDEQIIAALKNVIDNDPSISVRNFARSALDVFGIEHSEMELPICEQVQRQELDAITPVTSPKVNIGTAIGIGFLVGFIGTLFLASLMIYGSVDIFFLVVGAIGGVFGVLGSVIGFALIGSKRAVWIGAILGTILIPCYLFIALLGGAG